jgi:outer membrane protein assembly factor BamB
MPAPASPSRGSFRKLYVFLIIVAAAVIFFLAKWVPFAAHDLLPGAPAVSAPGKYSYAVPLDPDSPWPKFRANELQNGRSPVLPAADPAARPWSFATGKGIFSSPVVDGEGTVYVGSADRVFYALGRDGSLKWKFETGGIIDSAALLDDRGRVYFGSGDQYLYCLDRGTGKVIWTFKSHSPAEVLKEFGVKAYNLVWFEGNVGMLPDGTILAGNDNYLLYALDRDSGGRKTQYIGNEMVWSLPAVNAKTGRLFFGTDFMALKNIFCFDIGGGGPRWTAGGLGTVAATPLLTSDRKSGGVLLGGFDGYLRAFAQDSGKQLWKFGARDHIYASPAQLSDGTIIQPSADGTVYALDPRNGRLKWAYDTSEPIRSSPAVAGDDSIYVGGGDGRLLCIGPDGKLRWSFRCIDGDRNDLNASPALGKDGVYLAGENGGIFFVPWDYPLTAAGRKDPRCGQGGKSELVEEGAFLVVTSPFGSLEFDPPAILAANEPLTLSLLVRKAGNTELAAIDRNSIRVRASGDPRFSTSVSANRAFLTVVPRETWTGPAGGRLDLRVTGTYTVGLSRFGLKFFGGRRGGALDASYSFDIRPRGSGAMPYVAPRRPGDPQSVFELSRLAVPEPAMLPSWNQIGFDSLRYLAGAVEGGPDRALLWVIGGRPAPSGSGTGAIGAQAAGGAEVGDAATVADPSLEARFPLVLDWDGGLVTLHNYDGFKINFVGSWDMPFAFYRIAAAADPATGVFSGPAGEVSGARASLNAVALCDQIRFYGPGLKLMGMSEFDTGRMTAAGGLRVSNWKPAGGKAAGYVARASFSTDGASAKATVDPASSARLRKGDHVYSLFLVDAASGAPFALYYTKRTTVEADADGNVRAVRVAWDKGEVRGRVRAWLMVDTYPAASAELDVPASP